LIGLEHAVRIGSLNGQPTAKVPWQASNSLVSDTKELSWTAAPAKGGLVSVETERSTALIGFIRANPVPLRNMMLRLQNRFAAVTLSSLDENPIARSERLLLTAGAMAANTGGEWNEDRTVLQKAGSAPTLIEPVTGDLVLRNLAPARKVTIAALDGRGQVIGSPVLAKKTSEGWQAALGEHVTTWYEVRVER